MSYTPVSKVGSREKDLGIIVSHQLKFHLHIVSVASKVNWILGIIGKSLPCYLFLTKALIHSVIENANSIWGPFSLAIRECYKKSTKTDHPINNFLESSAIL